MGVERNKDFYNKFYDESVIYKKEPKDIIYFPIWRDCINYIHRLNPCCVIDLGCGPGHIATILRDDMPSKLKEYIGYDFSIRAIEMARKSVNDDRFVFKAQDLNEFDFVETGKDVVYIASEFFEHISNDLDILDRIESGNHIVFSLPSFDSNGHVRYFKCIEDIKDRYDSMIDIIEYNTYILSLFSFIILCLGIKK